MLTADAAIIGGTGVGSRLATLGGRSVCIPTPLGPVRGSLLERSGKRILLLRRHGYGHKMPPHRVNYAAMALALKAAKVPFCLATAAVGSLRAEWGPGTFVIPHDFLDLSGRNITLHDRDVVHTDFSKPLPARDRLIQAASNSRKHVVDGGIYVGGNGPRYESPHEIQILAKVGDVVGMTASSEAIVMREAGVDYGLLAIITNLACGIASNPLSHDEVVDQMNLSGADAVELLLAAALASN